MTTRAQAQAFRKGTLATMEREKERKTTYVAITHSPQVQDRQLAGWIDQTLAAAGVGRINVRLSEDMQWQAAYEHSEQKRLDLEAQLKALAEENAALKAGRDTREWITIAQLAERLDRHYITVWRAAEDDRLVTKPMSGTKKKHVLCDPTTYIPATRGKKTPK